MAIKSIVIWGKCEPILTNYKTKDIMKTRVTAHQ